MNEDRTNEHHPVLDCDIDVSFRTNERHEIIDAEAVERVVQASDGGDIDECIEDKDENEYEDENEEEDAELDDTPIDCD